MSIELQSPQENTATGLVNGIIEDVQHLMKQQMELTRREIVADVRKAKEATVFYGLGGGLFFLGGVALCFALAHLIHWATSPPGSDPARFPLWACHAVVGSLLALTGGVFVWAGELKWKSIDPLQSTASEELKQNVDWGLHRK